MPKICLEIQKSFLAPARSPFYNSSYKTLVPVHLPPDPCHLYSVPRPGVLKASCMHKTDAPSYWVSS